MRLVHLSDLHLGFRSYDRMTARGVNQREADVARSFARAIDQTIAQQPELVVIGGDVFHSVRPPNSALKHACAQIARLRASLPHTEVVMVAGNHDTPRTADTGSIIGLFSMFGVHVIDGPAKRIDFAHLDCSVLAVADNVHAKPVLAPAGNRRFNVLLLHGEAAGISPANSLAAAHELSVDDMHAAEWSYVALGHYHVYREIAANCFYSGATDYTSSNIWGERVEEQERGLEGKGIVSRDLVTGAQAFHALEPTRGIVDLPPLSVLDFTADEASDAIGDAVATIPDGIDGKIVRLVVTDIPVHVYRALDHRMLKDVRKRALHFHLVTSRPEARMSGATALVRRRAPLDAILAEHLRTRELPSNVNRDALVALGAQMLDDAGEVRSVSVEHSVAA